ncbi:hypothetical protein [Rheinheimera sp.]|uniref:hypothetical protein n=1 Tax=Rheinheimera sp. TaxID=1869214 RepID=UPI0027BA01E9|nr:hypothetical protein [Rheinheimera sp.]
MYQITASTRKIRARILPALWVGGKFICLLYFSATTEFVNFGIFLTLFTIFPTAAISHLYKPTIGSGVTSAQALADITYKTP